MKNSPDKDDPLAALFSAPLPPLPGDAFTTRVIGALPPRRRAPVSPWYWVLAGGGAGTVFAVAKGASWSALTGSAKVIAGEFSAVLLSAADPRLALALIGTALTLLLGFVICRQFAPRIF